MCGGGGDGSDNDSYSATRPGEEAGGERQTYRSAMTGMVESNIGDTRSDQDMENDSRLSEALERGDRSFTNVNTGRSVNVNNYSRAPSAPIAGSPLANLNSPPSVGLFGSLGSFIPGVGGFAGRIVGGAIDRSLGTSVTLGGNQR
jgi:hypothetical protein